MPWGLESVLKEKYHWSAEEAQQFCNFLLPMLEYDPKDRATAAQCLAHPWLNTESPCDNKEAPKGQATNRCLSID